MKNITSFIEFENVDYKINDRKILSNINWKINNEDNWVILGPNGSGKTTLLKMIYGFIWPNSESSRILRLGKEFLNLPEFRKSIGLVSSFIGKKIPFNEKVLDTVVSGKFAMFGFWENGVNNLNKADFLKAERYLEILNAISLKNQIFSSLSQGEQQKILIARALMSKPCIILLDEPCSSLDPRSREEFLISLKNIIKETENKISYVLITHHIEEIIFCFNKVLLLKDGKILKEGDTKKVMTSENISILYDRDFNVKFFKDRYWLTL